jgi:hypothetical protein
MVTLTIRNVIHRSTHSTDFVLRRSISTQLLVVHFAQKKKVEKKVMPSVQSVEVQILRTNKP